MKLSCEDSDLFFKLHLSLLAYANKKLQFIPNISTFEEFKDLEIGNKAMICDGLHENIELIDNFVDENPEDFPLEELAIVSKWKNAVKGRFVIERHLKTHTIFIGETNKVYGVLGLMEPLVQMIPKHTLPIYVEAVLLPFNGMTIYDGFLYPYDIYFGSGLKEDLKYTYLKAKRRDEIILSIDPNTPKVSQKEKPAKDWKPYIKELTEKSSKLRGGQGHIELLSPTFSLVKASVELADLATEKEIELEDLYKCLDKIKRHLNNTEKELLYLDDW